MSTVNGGFSSHPFEVGDLVEHVTTGRRRVVVRITPAGAMGTSHRDGPTYHLQVVDDDDRPVLRGHVADAWGGSISYPLGEWRLVTVREMVHPPEWGGGRIWSIRRSPTPGGVSKVHTVDFGDLAISGPTPTHFTRDGLPMDVLYSVAHGYAIAVVQREED